MKGLSIIVPHRNNERLLSNFLNSLSYQSFLDFQLIVVDNGSQDGSFKALFRKNYRFPRKLIRFSENQGFAKAVNKAIEIANTPYILISNNDVTLSSECLEKMISFADCNPQIDVLTCRVMKNQNRLIIDSLGNGISKEGKCFQIGWNKVWKNQLLEPLRVFGASGAFMFSRKEVFKKVGLFDETYFIYLEDADWALRAFAKGVYTVALPWVVAYHEGSASSGGHYSDFSLYWILRNQWLLAFKNFPEDFFRANLFWFVTGQLKTAGKAMLIKRKPRIFFRALKDFFRLLPAFKKIRTPLPMNKIKEAIEISEKAKKLLKDTYGAFRCDS